MLNQKSMFLGGSDRYTSSSDVTVGTGARCISVSQLRDPYLDIRYRNELSSVGAADAKLSGLEQLTTILDEVGAGDDGEGVIEAQFNDLAKALQDLSTSGAGRDEYDTLVRSSASALTILFNTYGDKLQTLQENQTVAFKQDIDTVNDLLKSIRTLDEEIYSSEIHGSDALELKDARNQYIDQLSQYIRIDVTYEQVKLGTGDSVDKLVIKMAGNDPNSPTKNTTLVDGNYVAQLSVTQLSETTTDPVTGEVTTTKSDDPNFGITVSELTDKTPPFENSSPTTFRH